MSIPIVIRLGKAFGLMMTSGVIPVYVKGISTLGHNIDKTPFCPCRDENLSPITGRLSNLSFTKTFSADFPYPPVIITPSTEHPSDSLL